MSEPHPAPLALERALRPAVVIPVAMSEQSFLDVVLPGVAGCGDRARADQAEKLLWSAQYLGDVSRMRAGLVGPAGQIAAVRRRPAWLLEGSCSPCSVSEAGQAARRRAPPAGKGRTDRRF
jgi:hypothetical protein